MRLAWLLVIGAGCGDGGTQAPAPDAAPPCVAGLSEVVTVGAEAATSIATGFLDPGRGIDLVLANGSVQVMLGQPDHAFTPGWREPPLDTRLVALGDLNGDGTLDLVTATPHGLGTLLGNGDGSFTSKEASSSFAPPTSLALADLDLDGNLDIIVSEQTGGAVEIFRGAGDGTFAFVHTLQVGTTPGPIAIGDLDDDLYPDIVVTASGTTPAVVSVLWGGPGATFSAPDAHPFTSPSALPFGAAIGDVSGDGHLDIVVANGGGNELRILAGDGHRHFTDAPPLATQKNLPMSVAIGDVDRDGAVDLVTGTMGAVEVFHGDRTGGFGASQVVPTMDPSPRTLALADINDDRLLDVVLADDLGPPQLIYGACVR